MLKLLRPFVMVRPSTYLPAEPARAAGAKSVEFSAFSHGTAGLQLLLERVKGTRGKFFFLLAPQRSPYR